MTLIFAVKLGLTSRPINFDAQKTDDLYLNSYDMIIVEFSIQNSLGKIPFFEKCFLLADISIEIVLKMFFLNFSNANIKFMNAKLNA